MNKTRRTALDKLASQLDELKGKVDDIRSQLEELKDEEQEYFDNMPESLQGGDKGSVAEAAVDALDSAVQSLETIDGEMTEAIDYINNSMEG